MLLGALLVLCIIGIALALILSKNLRKALIVLFISGFTLGFITEYFGVHRGMWEYTETSTFMFFDIPFEILILYATALMFSGLVVIYLVKFCNKHDWEDNINTAYFIIGVIFFVAYLFGVGLSIFALGFFALWGLSISKKKDVPMLFGIIAFITDVVVEGSLSIFTNYYEWTLEVPFAFMFFAVAFAGYATSGRD